MSDEEATGAAVGEGDISAADVADTPGYVPPQQKSMAEMLEQDKEDESLEKYKKALLKDAAAIKFPDDPRKVIVTRLGLVVEGREEMQLDLQGASNLKDNPVTLKGGEHYKIKIYFYIQREIVSGLVYVQKTSRKGITVDSSKYMVGSYGPSMEEQSWTSQLEEVPNGFLQRGHYMVKSLFTDDDKHEHQKWEWSFKIKDHW